MSMFPSRVARDSLRRPAGRDALCESCGYKGIAQPPARCPKCEEHLSFSKGSDEIVTKTLDGDNDLFK
jgi:hypothetical protein